MSKMDGLSDGVWGGGAMTLIPKIKSGVMIHVTNLLFLIDIGLKGLPSL